MVLDGFTAHKIHVKGTVKMQVSIGTNERIRTEEIKFYMVDINSPYNAILNTPSHTTFDLIISMFHQQVKFSNGQGVGFVKSRPKSLLIYIMKVKRKRDEDSIGVEINMITTKEDSKNSKTS